MSMTPEDLQRAMQGQPIGLVNPDPSQAPFVQPPNLQGMMGPFQPGQPQPYFIPGTGQALLPQLVPQGRGFTVGAPAGAAPAPQAAPQQAPMAVQPGAPPAPVAGPGQPVPVWQLPAFGVPSGGPTGGPAPTIQNVPGMPHTPGKLPVVTYEDIAAGRVPGWGIDKQTGQPKITDESKAGDVSYVDQHGTAQTLAGSASGSSGTGTTDPKKMKQTSSGPGAVSTPENTPWPNQGPANFMKAWGLDTLPALQAMKPGEEYIQPGQMQDAVSGAINPVTDVMKWVADQMKAHGLNDEAKQMNSAIDTWHKAIPVRSALAYVQNLPSQTKSAQTAGDLPLGTPEVTALKTKAPSSS
jgi:hypothetical protein